MRIDTHGFLDPIAYPTGKNGSLPGPASTPELRLHSAASSYAALPSHWDDSSRDHASHISGQNPLEYFLSQPSASMADSYGCQKLHTNTYGHAPSGVDMLTGFEVPLTESGELIEQISFSSNLLAGLGLWQDANLRNLYGNCLGGSNPWLGLSHVPDHRLHPLMSNPHTPPHQLTSDDDYIRSALAPHWGSTAIPATTSDLIGENFDGSIVGPKSTPFNSPNGPSEATPDLTIQKQKIAPPVTVKTALSHIDDKEVQSSSLAQPRHHGSANRSLRTVSNSSQRSTKALPYRRTLCKKDLSYTPEYLRIALSRLLKIVAKSLFVSQNMLEPTIGSELAKTILIEVLDTTGVWLGDKVGEGESLYFLFIDRTSNLSLICGHDTRTSDRALGHIRSMLDHRPFPCLGKSHGCNSKKCSGSGDRPFRFFTEALRDDHIRRQGLKDECTTCGAMIRRGGMNRHVRLIHPETSSTPVLGEEGSGEKIS